jgi:hypothetical protein
MVSKPSRPPYYIVGLPEDSIEAGDARTKFERLSADLCKVFPFIEEIRAVVKAKNPSKLHTLYEVSVEIFTPRERHAFTETGYDLAQVFDTMGPKMKRLLSQKRHRGISERGETPRKTGV